MSLKRDYIRTTTGKMTSGPGGWHCPCCNPYSCEVRKMKRKARRRIRRTAKQKFITGELNAYISTT